MSRYGQQPRKDISEKCRPDERMGDDYRGFLLSIKKEFEDGINGGRILFRTDVKDLFDTFLDHLPKEARDHYNCSTCRGFVRKFGGLVYIDQVGDKRSVLWGKAPAFFQKAVNAMKEEVLKSKVLSVFVHDSTVLGTPITGEWEHMSVTMPRSMVRIQAHKSSGQLMAISMEEFRMLKGVLNKYSAEVAEKVHNLLGSDTMNRDEICNLKASWFDRVNKSISKVKDEKRADNLLWLEVALAPVGYCHVGGSMLDTLLGDMNDGLDVETIRERYEDKVRADNYMREKSDPKEGEIKRAEELVEEYGVADSLQRRFATLEEIPTFLWKDKKKKEKVEKSSGVFGCVVAKIKDEADSMDLPESTMTWEKFQKKVLPKADSIEVMVDKKERLMAMVTAAIADSKNMLKWDNQFSWYYHNGIDGEIKRRVEEAGGLYEDNEIRCSLIWNNRTDLDLHCIEPSSYEISYKHHVSQTGGELDVDMNVHGETTTPVENIRWRRNAPEGSYEFVVDKFKDRSFGDNPYTVELQVGNKIYKHTGNLRMNDEEIAFKFMYHNGKVTNMIGDNGEETELKIWGLRYGGFASVTGITTSPNMWGDKPKEQSGEHTFFLLDGCRDDEEEKGRGLFTEMLLPEYHEIRKTLGSYFAKTAVTGKECATACGVGFSKDTNWNLTLRVREGKSRRVIKIDRFD